MRYSDKDTTKYPICKQQHHPTTQMTPQQLQQHLATLSKEQRAQLFSQALNKVTQHLSHKTVKTLQQSDPLRLNRMIIAQLLQILNEKESKYTAMTDEEIADTLLNGKIVYRRNKN